MMRVQDMFRKCVKAAVVVGCFSVLMAVGCSPVAAQAPIRGADAGVVATINEHLASSWKNNAVEPSPLASDTEWVRRVYLDLVGHIPPVEVVEEWVNNPPEKDMRMARRAELVDRLLKDPAYTRNWTTIWTNLSIGHVTPDRTSRFGMKRFFRKAFAKNRPWNEVVYDLLTARGAYEENGAVNFLLGQMTMNDQQVLATAKTTRLLLGVQVQCTQCHNHPFNDWKQAQFWQFNSFLRDVKRIDHETYDPDSGMMVDDYSELVSTGAEGPVFFEKRNGLMQVAYPVYEGHRIEAGADVDRMKKLADLITHGDDRQLALSFVNRTWGHFFGYGFTRPIDDMGPHNPASHPELLNYLADQFIANDYNIKKLIRWIVSCDAYHLTSATTAKNSFDRPSAGSTPLFSHMYLKGMTAEQLYDSLIIATQAHKAGKTSWEESEKQRQEWLQQFINTFATDEGGETSTFNGTIPQALVMMNGELIAEATSVEPGSFLNDVLQHAKSPNDAIRRLYMASLGRIPRSRELAAAKKLFAVSPTVIAGYQDLFWALLNSNEFIFIR